MKKIIFQDQKILGTCLGFVLMIVWLYSNIVTKSKAIRNWGSFTLIVCLNFGSVAAYEIIRTFELMPQEYVDYYPWVTLSITVVQVVSSFGVELENEKDLVSVRILGLIPLICMISSKNTEAVLFLMFSLLKMFWNPKNEFSFYSRIVLASLTVQVFYFISGVSLDIDELPVYPANLFFGKRTSLSLYLSLFKMGYCYILGIWMCWLLELTYYNKKKGKVVHSKSSRKNSLILIFLTPCIFSYFALSLSLTGSEHFTQGFVFSNFLVHHLMMLISTFLGYIGLML